MSERMPMPLQEWIVNPPICVAAMPVEAVTAGSIPCSRSHATNSLTVCVLPLPGSPVRNTFAPVFRIESASAWVIGLYYTPPEILAFHRVRREFLSGFFQGGQVLFP